MFSEKLNLLMNLTNTSNSLLAKQLSFDPSYISRLRKGQRRLQPECGYEQQLSDFLASRLQAENKTELFFRLAESHEESGQSLSMLVMKYLCSEQQSEKSTVNQLLDGLSKMNATQIPSVKQSNGEGIQNFFGNEGRRQAQIALLNRALIEPRPVVLFLFSDEGYGYMEENSSYFYEWSSLMWQVILKGCKIKVIHKISRDIDEMLNVVRQWLPFYASGQVEPFYYPKLRDGVYKRTLSVIPGVSAVFSTSIGAQTDYATTFMTGDRLTVDSFTNEFSTYLTLCKPLLQIFQPQSFSLDAFFPQTEVDQSRCFLQSDGLPLQTMPIEITTELASNIAAPKQATFLSFAEASRKRFEERIACEDTCHIFRLEPPEAVLQGNALLSCSLLSSPEGIRYSAKAYLQHVNHMLELAQANEHYIPLLTSEPKAGHFLYLLESHLLLMIKEQAPCVAFRMTEPNMLSAFLDYFEETVQTVRQKTSKEYTIEQLKAYLALPCWKCC